MDWRSVGVGLLGCLQLFAVRAYADEPSADSQRAAAEAYDKGTARFLGHDYSSAADWFETAQRLVPNALALQSAIRAHRQVGTAMHLARAATLALELRAQYPQDTTSTRIADDVIQALSPTLASLTIRCGACDVEIDGTLESAHDLYLTPGEHHLAGHWKSGHDTAVTLQARAGKESTFDWADAPPSTLPAMPTLPTVATVPPSTAVPFPPTRAAVVHDDSRLSPAWALSGVAITAALGGATAVSWFGDAVPNGNKLIRGAQQTHLADPTLESQVQGAETRTTVLLVATSVVGAATLATALLFTRWTGHKQVVGIAPFANGCSVALGARF